MDLKNLLKALVFILSLGGSFSCSSASIYENTSVLRYRECRKIIDPEEREHCFRTADIPYEQYQKLNEGK